MSSTWFLKKSCETEREKEGEGKKCVLCHRGEPNKNTVLVTELENVREAQFREEYKCMRTTQYAKVYAYSWRKQDRQLPVKDEDRATEGANSHSFTRDSLWVGNWHLPQF